MNNSFPFSTFCSTTFNILESFQIIYIFIISNIIWTLFWLLFPTFVPFSGELHGNDCPTNSDPDFTVPSGKLQVRSLLSSNQPSCHRLLYQALPHYTHRTRWGLYRVPPYSGCRRDCLDPYYWVHTSRQIYVLGLKAKKRRGLTFLLDHTWEDDSGTPRSCGLPPETFLMFKHIIFRLLASLPLSLGTW